MISQEKWMTFTPLQKLPKNVGDLDKLIVAKGFISCTKSNKLPNLVTFLVSQPNFWGVWLLYSWIKRYSCKLPFVHIYGIDIDHIGSVFSKHCQWLSPYWNSFASNQTLTTHKQNSTGGRLWDDRKVIKPAT